MSEEIFNKYELLKKAKKQNPLGSDEVFNSLRGLFNEVQNFLSEFEIGGLDSKVNGKTFFSFCTDNKNSRAVNKKIYDRGLTTAPIFFDALSNNDFEGLNSDDITAACYSISIGFCAVIDLLKSGDQKTPGTFFEYFIGHLYARRLETEPVKKIEVLNLDREASLPTDFIFDLGVDRPKFHLPVKTSTRERVIQVWAHQRLLDGVYGTGRFFGTLVCLTETKLDKKKLEVVEICLPMQWQLYQMYISQLKRIYYLDPPEPYINLNNAFPRIPVKKFGDFFFEVDSLAY